MGNPPLMGYMCICTGPADVLAQGNLSILINGVPVVSQGDMTAHGGVVMSGEPNILISTSAPSPAATMPLDQIPFPEIRLFDRIGAALNSDTVDLQEAQGISSIETISISAKISILNQLLLPNKLSFPLLTLDLLLRLGYPR